MRRYSRIFRILRPNRCGRKGVKYKKAQGAEKIPVILGILEREYGIPAPGPGRAEDPLDELVRTILSQNTNDVNRDRALEGLHRRFKSWEETANAKTSSWKNPFASEDWLPKRRAAYRLR